MARLHHEDDDTFTKRIMPELERVEETRRGKADEAAKRMKIAVAGAVTAVLLAIGSYVYFKPDGDGVKLIFGCALGLCILLGWWQDQPRQQFEKEYKQKVLPQVARLLGLSSYSATGGMTAEEMLPSRILPYYTSSKTEDCFEGDYKGARLRFCELLLEKTEGTGKNRRTVTVFRGLAIMVRLPVRKFYGQTILVRDAGGFSEWFKERVTELKRADLVDPEFEKKFTVYTSDQVEARYLIDPAMMERIQKISDVYAARGLSMSYYGDSQVLSLVDCKRNQFEPPSIYHPATNIDAVMKIKHELAELLNFLDFLQLYRPIEQPQPTHGANPP